MKLLAATALTALSLVGCASDNEGTGGAFLSGLRPSKPSLDDTKSPVPGLNPAIAEILEKGGLDSLDMRGGTDSSGDNFIVAETIKSPFPIDTICEACDLVVLRDVRNPSELNVIDDHGHFFCRLWVSETGRIESTDCR